MVPRLVRTLQEYRQPTNLPRVPTVQTTAMQQWQTEALQESWREPGHEAMALAAGTLLADLRS